MKKTMKCDPKLTFQECELAILRFSVDLAQTKMAKQTINSPEIQEMISIVEDFLKIKKLVCYGGQGINQELPEQDRFYNKDIDIPDYDFYSPHALEDAKELADLYFLRGYEEVEAKTAVHHNTFKVFVNSFPVADVTYMPPALFSTIQKKAVQVAGILYAPPNFLRMGMYLELSRPAGDTDRWEKVAKRLSLINKHFPVAEIDCSHVDFQRKMEMEYKDNETQIYEVVRDALINQGVVFFGGFAIAHYSHYMNKKTQNKVKQISDFDVLDKNPEITAKIVKERLHDAGFDDVHILKRPSVGEIIPEQTEITVGKDIVAVLYPPVACHSFNSITLHGQKIKIATIDTMLSFYLAFLYADKSYYNPDRLACMAKFLFDVQQKNRLNQKGLLRRFTITCYGRQSTIQEMRLIKSKMFEKLKNKKKTREFDEWFLRYRPSSAILSKKKNKSTNTYFHSSRDKSVKQQKVHKKTQKKRKGKNTFFDAPKVTNKFGFRMFVPST